MPMHKRTTTDSTSPTDPGPTENPAVIVRNSTEKPSATSLACLCPTAPLRGMEVVIGGDVGSGGGGGGAGGVKEPAEVHHHDHEVTNGDLNHHYHMNSPAALTTTTKTSYHRRIPERVSLIQMVLLNAVVCGLEISASAAFTYIPPMLLKAGLPEQEMSVILGIGPCLGFFFVPMIGRASDRCRSSFGRRRPFILGLGLSLIVSLLVIPYSDQFAVHMFGLTTTSKALSIWLLIIGSVMLDFSSQVALSPCEALLSDACKHTKQEERGFMVYSFMVSLGGCIGYLITAIDWTDTALGRYFGGQERSAFSVLIILFTLSLVATLMIAQESPLVGNPAPQQTTPPPSIDIATKLDEIHQHIVRHKQLSNGILTPQDPGYESDSNRSQSEESLIVQYPDPTRTPSKPNPSLCPVFISEHLCHIPWTRWSILNYRSFFYLLWKRIYRLLPNNLTHLFELPLVLRRLALANFFSWTAVMSFNIFYTDYVGQHIYLGNPNAAENSLERALYDDGVRMGSWGLLFHCIVAALYSSVFVERVMRRVGMRTAYMLGMLTFTAAMFVMCMSRSLLAVNLMAAVTGIGYATLTTIPFMLVNTYNVNTEVYYFDVKYDEVRGIGTDISTIDSAYFLSQVILSALMGSVVHVSGSVVAYIVVAGAMGGVSCACIGRLVITRAQVTQEMALMGRAGGVGGEDKV